MNKQNRGITLVALVITIIVLIILAAVSINAIMNDGLIKNAKDAKNAYDNATKKEQGQISALLAEVEHYDLPDVVAGGYTGTSNAKYKDANGEIAIIPAGFTVSNIKTDTVDETTISKGLVIYSGEVTNWTNVQVNYNQYVWIPVENPSDIYGTLEGTVNGILGSTTDGVTTTKFGKLYFGEYTTYWNYNTNQNSHYNWPGEVNYSYKSYREPAYLEDSLADDSSYNIDAEGNKIITQYVLLKEFNDMIASVEKYKGFYIGRYELTGDSTNPTVRKGKNPLLSTKVELRWYGLYNMCEKLEASNDKVKSTMIWGCQWDQAVKMSLIDKTDFLTNAKAYGVYSDSTKNTQGITGRMLAAYNIYDMGGNVHDWTLEGVISNYRVYRGGSSSNNSTTRNAASRYGNNSGYYPGSSSANIGCRAQLYIN